MFHIFFNLAVLAVTVAVSWPLSAFDSRVTGDFRADFPRRAVRCGLTLLVVEVAFYYLWRYRMTGDRSAGLTYLAMLVPLAMLWAGCISEAGAQSFLHMIDPKDKRPYDRRAGVRELDAIGGLIRSGRKEEAVQLCRMLLQTSPEHRAALELTLHHLDAPPLESARESNPLAEATQLRQAGKFNEAEAILTSLLKEKTSNVNAALMLIRLYGQDMRQSDKAAQALRALEKDPHVSRAYIEFARRSIMEWQTQPANAAKAIPEEPMPESVEELIAKKHLGSAVDLLERQCEAEPGNFDGLLKLAEVHGVHCANIPLAEKTIRRIVTNPAFNLEQKEHAQHRLREWRKQQH